MIGFTTAALPDMSLQSTNGETISTLPGPNRAGSQIVLKKLMQVFEADIRSYFTRINRQWLRKMVAHRIADPVILSLIGKWLNAGVLEAKRARRLRRVNDAAIISSRQR